MFQLTEKQKDLAAVRRLATESNTPQEDIERDARRNPRDVHPTAVKVAGLLLDPSRPTAPKWERTEYTATRAWTVKGNQLDGGDGFGVSIGKTRKVRAIHWPRIGEVIEVDALTYEKLARETCSLYQHGKARWEPVPDDTKVRGPILPPNFPSDPEKARRIVSKGTGKAADQLTLADMITYFEAKPKQQFVKC